jgi:hypothetical protein
MNSLTELNSAPVAGELDPRFFVKGQVVEGTDALTARATSVTFASPGSTSMPWSIRATRCRCAQRAAGEIIDLRGRPEAGRPQQRICPGLHRSHGQVSRPRAVIEHQMLPTTTLKASGSGRADFNPKGARRMVPHTHQPAQLIAPGPAPSTCCRLTGMGIRSIAQSALVKSVSLFKMPSADPFSTVAFLRTMADIDPEHPLVKSMSAVYWRGGDDAVERVLYRPQYFDKLVAWGAAMRSTM